MSEPLQSFLVFASCVIGLAILVPCVELIAIRLRRDLPSNETPDIVRLTPPRSERRTNL